MRHSIPLLILLLKQNMEHYQMKWKKNDVNQLKIVANKDWCAKQSLMGDNVYFLFQLMPHHFHQELLLFIESQQGSTQKYICNRKIISSSGKKMHKHNQSEQQAIKKDNAKQRLKSCMKNSKSNNTMFQIQMQKKDQISSHIFTQKLLEKN